MRGLRPLADTVAVAGRSLDDTASALRAFSSVPLVGGSLDRVAADAARDGRQRTAERRDGRKSVDRLALDPRHRRARGRDPAARPRLRPAPASPVTRAAAWLVARLGVVLVPLWIAAAVGAALYLPGIEESGGGALGGLVPAHSAALAAQEREVREFGNTLLTRIVVVQHAAGGLTRPQVQRTLALAANVDRGKQTRFRYLRVAAPLVDLHRTTTVTYLYFGREASNAQALDIAKRYAQALDPPGLRTGPLLARDAEFAADPALAAVGDARDGRAHPRRPARDVPRRRAAAPRARHRRRSRTRSPSTCSRGSPRGGTRRCRRRWSRCSSRSSSGSSPTTRSSSSQGCGGGSPRAAAGSPSADETARENLPIIVTAGLIVALGSLSLVVGHLEVFRSFGPGMALTVAVALAVTTTFTPGLLALLGPLAFWPSLRPRGARAARGGSGAR